jgi:hypothetical protein
VSYMVFGYHSFILMCYVVYLLNKKINRLEVDENKFSEVNKWKIIGIHSYVLVRLSPPVGLNDCKTMFPHCGQNEIGNIEP